MSANELEVRSTGKGILTLPDDTLVLVQGKRPRWNLPGGGADPGETDLDAFLREVEQELGLTEEDLIDLRPALPEPISDEVTSASGVLFVAKWTVFVAGVRRSREDLSSGHEISRVGNFPPEEAVGLPNISNLATTAIRQFYGLQLPS